MAFLRLLNCLLIVNIFIFNKLSISVPPERIDIIECTDEENLMILREGNKAHFIESYMPKMRCKINVLMEGDKLIWKATDPQEYISLLKVHSSYDTYRLCYVYTWTDPQRNTRYYTRLGLEWHEVHEKYYTQYVKWLESMRIFDIQGFINDEWIFRQEHKIYGLNATVLVPYPYINMVEVCDGEEVIWKRNDELDISTAVIVHGELHTPQMINVHSKMNGFYVQTFYKKEETGWKELEKEDFYRILNELDAKKESERKKSESKKT